MGLVTVFCPLTTTGTGKLALQTEGETRLVADCRVNPAAFVGHVTTTLVPERVMVSCGGPGNVRLNTVPAAELPPADAVPYRVLPDKINPVGLAPSLLV